ncbi:MAG: hypothetical protein ACRDJN_23620 [Chloroflexota bacterium]
MVAQTHAPPPRSTSQGAHGSTASGASSIDAGLERLLEPVLYEAFGLAALLAVLPLLVVALAVYGTLSALSTRHWAIKEAALAACALPAAVALLARLWALWLARPGMHGGAMADVLVADVLIDGMVDAVAGYVDVQLDAAAALLHAAMGAVVDGGPVDW